MLIYLLFHFINLILQFDIHRYVIGNNIKYRRFTCEHYKFFLFFFSKITLNFKTYINALVTISYSIIEAQESLNIQVSFE